VTKTNYSDEDLKKIVQYVADYKINETLERLRVLLPLKFKRFHASHLVYAHYEEARMCWYSGCYIATIYMCSQTFEELIRSTCRDIYEFDEKIKCGKKLTNVDNARFNDLIIHATDKGWVTESEAKELHNLRKNLRNAFVHTKGLDPNKNQNQLSYSNYCVQENKIIFRLFKGKKWAKGYPTVDDEAKEAIEMTIRLLPVIAERLFDAFSLKLAGK